MRARGGVLHLKERGVNRNKIENLYGLSKYCGMKNGKMGRGLV